MSLPRDLQEIVLDYAIGTKKYWKRKMFYVVWDIRQNSRRDIGKLHCLITVGRNKYRSVKKYNWYEIGRAHV